MGAHRGRECHYRKRFGEGCCSRSGRIPRRGAAVLRKAAQVKHTPFPTHKQWRVALEVSSARVETAEWGESSSTGQDLLRGSIHVQSGTDSLCVNLP